MDVTKCHKNIRQYVEQGSSKKDATAKALHEEVQRDTREKAAIVNSCFGKKRRIPEQINELYYVLTE